MDIDGYACVLYSKVAFRYVAPLGPLILKVWRIDDPGVEGARISKTKHPMCSCAGWAGLQGVLAFVCNFTCCSFLAPKLPNPIAETKLKKTA